MTDRHYGIFVQEIGSATTRLTDRTAFIDAMDEEDYTLSEFAQAVMALANGEVVEVGGKRFEIDRF